MRTIFGGTLLALCLGAVGIAQVPAGEAGGDLASIANRLASPKFEEREKAQRELEAIPPGQKDVLERWLGRVTDEEVRVRLAERIGGMEVQIATEMPGLTLSLKNAPLDVVAAAIRERTGMAIQPGEGVLRVYDLEGKDAPFWEVIRQMPAQHRVWITGRPSALSLVPLRTEGMVTSKGMAIALAKPDNAMMPAVLIRRRLPNVPVNQPGMELHLYAAIDPRIEVLARGRLAVSSITDEKGRNWPLVMPEVVVGPAQIDQVTQVQPLSIAAPQDAGEWLTISGAARFTVSTEEKTVVIENLARKVNEGVTLGSGTVTFRGLVGKADAAVKGIHLEIVPEGGKAPAALPDVEFSDNGISIKGGLRSVPGAAIVIDSEKQMGGLMLNSPSPEKATFIRVTDADGKSVASYRVGGGMTVSSLHMVDGAFKEPLKMELRASTKSREVVVPFEFKDVPAPR